MSEPDVESTLRGVDVGLAAELAIEGFEDAHLVGRGGFGAVYRCRQPSLDRVVAVKVLNSAPDAVDRNRFLREQVAMGRLSGHPNIVHVLEVAVTVTGRPFIVMAFHPRGSLDDWIQANGPLTVANAVGAGVKLAGALETAHRAGVLHRDVKPANVLLSEYGEPQLTDFGIAQIAGRDDTTQGSIAGSPAYTAPELLHDRAPSVASDVYGLAATLYTVLSGRPAFARRRGENVMAQLRRIDSEKIPSLRNKGVPDAICAVIENAMSREPIERPLSSMEFGSVLQSAGTAGGFEVPDLPIPLVLDRSVGPFRLSTEVASHRYARADMGEVDSRRPARPPTVSTKFRPPVITHAMVRRRHLLDRLRDAGRARLILIHGPAGFGKTTLAAQRVDELNREGIVTAWLSIDHDDNTVAWFLDHLVEAIRRVQPGLGGELIRELELRGAGAERYVLTALVNRLHENDTFVVVVLDDWHRVTDPQTRGAISFLLEQGCHHLQLVVTSRNRLGVPVSAMRVRRELVEIDTGALRFDVSESSELLVDHCGLVLQDADVADLEQSTDGWAAALQLVSLALRNHPDPHEFIGHISGRHRAIGEYLTENVVAGLEPDLLDFVLATSVTERICASLAATLSGDPRAQARLEDIEQRDLFLYRLDEDGEWFRYHHLFADFLRRRLERDAGDRIRSLHHTAAQWFTEREMTRQAVDHWLLAGDTASAVGLVERVSMDLLERSQMATLLGLAAKLPAGATADRPALQIDVAWAHALLHHREAAVKALESADRALDASPEDSETADRRVEVALIRATNAAFDDRIEGIAEAVQSAAERTTTLRSWQLCGIADLASYLAIYRFDFEDAQRWQRWAEPYHRQSAGPFSVIFGCCLSGLAAREQLTIAVAEAKVRRGMDLAIAEGGASTYAGRLTGALLGDLLYEQGDLIAAERLLDDSYVLGAEGGTVDFLLATYGTGARIKAIMGQRDTAVERLDEGKKVAQSLGLPRLYARIDNEQIRLGLGRDGSLVSSSRAPDSVDLEPGGVGVVTREIREDSAIRMLLDETRDSACLEATERARILADSIDPERRPRAALYARLLEVECLTSAEREEAAITTLVPLLENCAAAGLRRPLLDTGPGVRGLVERLSSGRIGTTTVPDHLATFLAAVAESD